MADDEAVEGSDGDGMEASDAAPAPTTETVAVAASNSAVLSLGAWVLIGVYLVFGVLLNEYWIGWLPLLVALGVVIVPRFGSSTAERIGPTGALLKAAGYVLGIIGLLTLIEDLRFAGSQLDSFVEVAGAILAYVGFGAAFLGARAMD